MSRKTIITLIVIALIAIILVIVFRKQIMGEAITAGNRKCCKWDMTGKNCIAFEGDPICGAITLT